MKFQSPASGYTPFLIIVLVLILAVTAVNYFWQPLAPSDRGVESNQGVDLLSPTATPSAGADLTDRQKIARLMIVPLVVSESTISGQTTIDQTAWSWITAQQPGGVILFGQKISTDSVASISAALNNMKKLPTWLAVDHEGGAVQRLTGDGFTPLDSWQKLCRQEELARQSALSASAQELAAAGIDLVFGPVVDVASRSSVLKDRVCSGDPELVSAVSRQAILAYQAVGILPVVKHFPGIGSLLVDLHKKFSVASPNNDDGMPFQLLLSEFPSVGVMTTFSGVSGVCENEPCALNQTCLTALTSRYPKSLLITDALDMTAAGFNASSSGSVNLADRSLLAVGAGNHLLLYGQSVTAAELTTVLDTLVAQYQAEPQFRQRVDAALTQIDGYRQWYKSTNDQSKGSI